MRDTSIPNDLLALAPTLPGSAGYVLLALVQRRRYNRPHLGRGALMDALNVGQRTIERAVSTLLALNLIEGDASGYKYRDTAVTTSATKMSLPETTEPVQHANNDALNLRNLKNLVLSPSKDLVSAREQAEAEPAEPQEPNTSPTTILLVEPTLIPNASATSTTSLPDVARPADPHAQLARHSLRQFFDNPYLRSGEQRKHLEHYLERRDYWLDTLPARFVLKVLECARVGDGVTASAPGAVVYWLENPLKAPEPAVAILAKARETSRAAPASRAGVTGPGEYATPGGQRVTVEEIYDGAAVLTTGDYVVLDRTTGWQPLGTTA